MRLVGLFVSIFSILFLTSVFASRASANDCVILLHGLARTSDSMNKMEHELESAGMKVVNVDYPSRKMPIEKLAPLAIELGIKACANESNDKLSFVTHSLGGILVRQYYNNHAANDVHKVVMLGPPNKGSEVVDMLKNMWGFELLNGPAGMQLGTGVADVPKQLGPVNFDLAVIAGTRSINWILSTFLPNPDDGKVSVESTKVDNMCSFLTLPTSHPFIMKNDEAIAQVVEYLRHGKFTAKSATNDCVDAERKAN